MLTRTKRDMLSDLIVVELSKSRPTLCFVSSKITIAGEFAVQRVEMLG